MHPPQALDNFCCILISESLDPDIVGIPEKVEPKNPLDDEILKKFLKEDSLEEKPEEEQDNEDDNNDENEVLVGVNDLISASSQWYLIATLSGVTSPI